MADKKISQLPFGALTPASILPIVANGITSQTDLNSVIQAVTPFVPVGAQGPQGSQGIQGVAGATGPSGVSGLVWQGTWSSASTYTLNSAVSFNYASYFCFSAITTTGNTNPIADVGHWTLLASQGATGPAGPQGPSGATGSQGIPGNPGVQGPQGIQGETGNDGPQGIQGIQGPTGPAGATGASGLVWQGTWAAINSYFQNDVVAYNGASYFCVSDRGGNPGNGVPPSDT